MLRRVEERPGLLVDRGPLLLAHLRMAGADVLRVVNIEIAIHGHAGAPERLVVLRARQRGEAEEFENVEWQFVLDDADVAPDRLRGVRGKAQDITAERHDALRLPGQ